MGLLCGWTAAGRQPTFSGVSTGGLIAPFAFLGFRYNHLLREVYTNGIAEQLLEDSSLLGVPLAYGAAGNMKLRQLVARYVDADVLRAVAIEHAKGR